MSDIAFLDVEASGPGELTFPVEVGWAFPDGRCEAHLIRPAALWLGLRWDPAAEELHGLSLERLLNEGEDVAAVAWRLNAALAGKRVHSDAPLADQAWLDALFREAGCEQEFVLRGVGELLPGGPLPAEARALADAAAPVRHRAGSDALWWAVAVRAVRRDGACG